MYKFTDTVIKYVLDGDLLTKYQAAYLPNSSRDQVLELYHKIQEARDEGKDVRFLFWGVSKAFDKVWHISVQMYLPSSHCIE